MTDCNNISPDPIETPANPIDGFVFKPAGSGVVQVWQKIDGQYVRTDEGTVRPEEKVEH